MLSIDTLSWFKDKLDYRPYVIDRSVLASQATSYTDFVKGLLSASTMEDVHALCQAISLYYGYNYFGVGLLYPKADQQFVCHHVVGKVSGWTTYYRQHLMFVDPFSDHCISHAVPLSWLMNHDAQQELYAVSPTIAEAFCEFGVTNVLSIPYHINGGVLGCFRLMCLNHQGLSETDMQRGIVELHSVTAYLMAALSKVLLSDDAVHGQKFIELTVKEQQVLTLIAKGYSANKIAMTLRIAENTVLTHTKRIYRKLGVNNRQLVIVRAMALGLL